MLIKIFGMPRVAATKELASCIARIALKEANTSSVRAGFSPIPIRRSGEEGPIRILVTGPDAHGIERRIKRRVAVECEQACSEQGIPWHGFEDPQLPGQP